MHLQSLTKFLSLVTPERLEGYLQEKGWTPGFKSETFRQWHRRGLEDLDTVEVATVRMARYEAMVELSVEGAAKADDAQPTAVLYDLLPPEHRGELVKAVFPELEAQGRAETGPMRFGNDWGGLFIRGDNAAAYAMALESLLRRSALTLPETLLDGLLDDLKSAHELDQRPRQKAMLLEALPEMVACERCDEIFPEGTACPSCAANGKSQQSEDPAAGPHPFCSDQEGRKP